MVAAGVLLLLELELELELETGGWLDCGISDP